MPAEMLTKDGRAPAEPVPAPMSAEDELREWARKHVERVHRLKLHVAAFVLGMVVLTPVWIVADYLSADGWPEHWSDNGNPGDWEPWILYVALVWGLIVAIAALKVYFDRPTTEAEIDRELERLKPRR